MVRPDRATLRSAGVLVLLTGVFVMVNSQVVYAAGDNSETGDLLAPLNITSSEGVPINGYELNAEGGSIVSFETQALAFALSGLFTLIRLLVGLAGWSIEVAFRFPLLAILTRPAQEVADTYNDVVVNALGLKGLLLAWAFVFASFMIVRGRVGRGLGEIFLTLLIGALAASTFVRPDVLLAEDGPLGQSQQVAAEVAQQSVNSYDWGGKLASIGPCVDLAGNAEIRCLEREGEGPVDATDVARPLQDSVTNALIVKPYMLLQYGRILDPAKKADNKAYAVHLKWVTGGYDAERSKQDREDACDLVYGPAKDYCMDGGAAQEGELPSLTPGGELLDASNAVVSEEDQEFAAFLADLEKAGDVGKACAAYAKQPTWWRIGGAALLLIAALFICGMLLSSAIVLLGTQGVCAAAAAIGGVAFIAGMLPGPARQSVWKWLSLWGIAVLAVVGICAFVPFFGIAVDATITKGPDLMVERILLIDVLAIAGAAGHRRLLAGMSSFGQRMAMRMRYAKIGGTHLPGDTSELGAALAMNSPTMLGGYGGGLRAFTGSGGGRYGILGTRHKLMGALASLTDGAGMPVDTGRVLADAGAEAGRGLAPLTAAAAVGGLGARLGAKGGHWLLIGKRPDREQLATWRKPTADGDPGTGGPGGPAGGGAGGGIGGGPRRPGGPPDRYRDGDGQVVDRTSGQVLHDQHADRTLLSTRAHNRLVRFRGYRILHRGSRAVYGATAGLPANVQRARSGGSRYSQDARQQVRVWGNTLSEDARAWAGMGRHVSGALRENTDDRGGYGPFTTRRLTNSPAAGGRRPTASQTATPGARPAAAPSAPTTGSSPRQASPTAPNQALQRLLDDPAELRRQTIANVARVDPALARAMRGNPSPSPSQASRGNDADDPAQAQAQDRERQRQAETLRQLRARWRHDDQAGEQE